jgi:hypothetical protein
VCNVQNLGPVARQGGDTTALHDADALERLHELARGIANIAHCEHRSTGEL